MLRWTVRYIGVFVIILMAEGLAIGSPTAEIGGLSLGMTATDARKAIAPKWEIMDSPVGTLGKPTPYSFVGVHKVQDGTISDSIMVQYYQDDGTVWVVGFQAGWKSGEGPLIKNLNQSLIAKYGLSLSDNDKQISNQFQR